MGKCGGQNRAEFGFSQIGRDGINSARPDKRYGGHMMRVLLLSCKTGEGHNSAALALNEAFFAAGAYSEICDPVSFAGDRASKNVCELYNSTIKKAPKVFGAVYNFGEFYSNTFKHSPVRFANSLYAKRLFEYIEKEKFDAVVGTHLYGLEAMDAVRRKFGCSAPTFSVLTDYTCIPFFAEPYVDAAFIPHADIIDETVKKGIPRERITVTGIPVAARFLQKTEKRESKLELGLNPDVRYYIIMTGGVGCGNISQICDGIFKYDTSGSGVRVLTGKNDKLNAKLNKKYSKNPRFGTVGFTKDVNKYMNAADVLITKPGGLSSTEAAVSLVPIVHYVTIPGCESRNADFFASHGMSVKASAPQKAAMLAAKLMNDPQKKFDMIAAQKREINPDAAADIVERVLNFER